MGISTIASKIRQVTTNFVQQSKKEMKILPLKFSLVLVCLAGFEKAKTSPVADKSPSDDELAKLKVLLKNLMECAAEGDSWEKVFDTFGKGCVRFNDILERVSEGHLCDHSDHDNDHSDYDHSDHDNSDRGLSDKFWDCEESEVINDELKGMTMEDIFKEKMDKNRDGCVTKEEHKEWADYVLRNC